MWRKGSLFWGRKAGNLSVFGVRVTWREIVILRFIVQVVEAVTIWLFVMQEEYGTVTVPQ